MSLLSAQTRRLVHVTSCKCYAALVAAVQECSDMINASVPLGLLLDVLMSEMERG